MVSKSDSSWRGEGSFPRRAVYEFAFNYLNGSNERIIGGEAEIRGFIIFNHFYINYRTCCSF